PQAQEHYTANLRDMLSILDRHLASSQYFGGGYSIADMTMYSDVHLHGVKDIGLNDYPNLKRWHDAIEARPAIQRAFGNFDALTKPSQRIASSRMKAPNFSERPPLLVIPSPVN